MADGGPDLQTPAGRQSAIAGRGPGLFDPAQDCRFMVRQVEPAAARVELERIAFDESYRGHAEKKYHHLVLKAYSLSAPAANILKQTCLSLGTDAGVHRGAINCTIEREAVLISATQAQLEKLLLKLRPQPFGLNRLAESVSRMLQRQRHLAQTPLEVMTILNLTPDSFSDGGRLASPEALLQAAQAALDAGATILDLGGESTRPGAQTVSEEEELARVLPAIQLLHSHFPRTVLSIDTRKSRVAQAALAAGASIVNDVSGLQYDPHMAHVVAQAGGKLVIMHSQGTPETMQQDPRYDDVIGEISAFFYRQVALAMGAGIPLERIILDPGFGFGKNLAHNLELMRRLPELASIGFPLLAGTSRKSFLTLGRPDEISVDAREALTAASLAAAVQAGARWLRIHDARTQMPVIQWLSRVYLEPV